MPMDFAELFEACLHGRLVSDVAREAGKPTAARLRNIAKPDWEWHNFLDPDTYPPLANAMGISVQTLLHATAWSLAEALDIPSLRVGTEESALFALAPPGTGRLKRRHLDLIHPLIRRCLEDTDREDRIAALEAENAALAARLAALEKPTRGRRIT